MCVYTYTYIDIAPHHRFCETVLGEFTHLTYRRKTEVDRGGGRVTIYTCIYMLPPLMYLPFSVL